MIRATIAAAALLLAGCATGTTVQDSATGKKADKPKEDTAALVAQRYKPCLRKLDADKPENQGSLFVVAQVPEGELTFRIRASNTGKTLTVPFDEFTVDQLSSVGC